MDISKERLFELSNECLAMKYVHSELSQSLQKMNKRLEKYKMHNKILLQTIREISSDYSKEGEGVPSEVAKTRNEREREKEKEEVDGKAFIIEQKVCESNIENEKLRGKINAMEKELENSNEKLRFSKNKWEDEMKILRERIGKEREILTRKHRIETSNIHGKHGRVISKMKIEMGKLNRRASPWTGALDIDQLRNTCQSQANDISKANVHLQTLRSRVTQLEFELLDSTKVSLFSFFFVS